MPSSWTDTSLAVGRRGTGAIVAFVCWVIGIAFVYAIVQGQAQTGALTGVMRAIALRTVVFAGRSALAEASHVIRRASGAGGRVLETIDQGANAGIAHDPQATRDIYQDAVAAGLLRIEPVRYEVVHRPPDRRSGQPSQIDLLVRVHYRIGSSRATVLTRQLRRRYLGRPCHIAQTLGPRQGDVVLSALSLGGEPLLEALEP